MKVLYIGHYRDGSGYSVAAQNYIFALHSIGVDVVPRAFRLNNNNEPIPKTIEDLEDQPSFDCDVCVQHTLPTYYQYNGNFRKNIGMLAVETHSVPKEWVLKCNMMDAIITFTEDGKSVLKYSGVTVPIHVIPHAFDTTKYNKQFKPTELRKNYPDDFLFYTIGEFVPRKDFETLIRAFHLAFNPSDPVQLIIKSNVPGKSPEESLKIISDFCNSIKASMGLYPSLDHYKKEVVIVHRLPDEAIQSIHNDCNCFVTTSHGEAWCIPAFEAQIGHGNLLIAPQHTAFKDWVKLSAYFSCNSYLVPANDANSPNGLYSSRHSWWQTDINDVITNMKNAVLQNNEFVSNYRNSVKKHLNEYLYEVVGSQLKEILK